MMRSLRQSCAADAFAVASLHAAATRAQELRGTIFMPDGVTPATRERL